MKQEPKTGILRGEIVDWMDEVRAKMKKKNQILFSPKDAFLQDLATLIGEQNHQTMVWENIHARKWKHIQYWLSFVGKYRLSLYRC